MKCLTIAALGVLTASASAAVDVTSIETTLIAGSPMAQLGLQGAGQRATSFPTTNNYNLTYQGGVERIDRLHTSDGKIYDAGTLADLVIRRNRGPNTDIVWYKGKGASTNPNLDLDSRKVADVEEAFAGNNLLVGSDNFFANRGDTNGNNSNIERLDFVFANGIEVSAEKGFAVFERGAANDHDPFKVVAITAIDSFGNPTDFGAPISFANGTWGKTALKPTADYIVTRKNNDVAGDDFRPSAKVTQTIGGLFVPLTNLQTGGRIFGFSLLGMDTVGSGTDLVDWTDELAFPDTTIADNQDKAGGLDPIGVSAVLFIPEPGTFGLLATAGLLALRRRR